MDDVFTSYEFRDSCYELGLPKGRYSFAHFLKKHAVQEEGHDMTWHKKTIAPKKQNTTLFEKPTPPPIIVSDNTQAIKNAIQLLKANNYKVLKPVTEFKEL